jgi:hypothetical protein
VMGRRSPVVRAAGVLALAAGAAAASAAQEGGEPSAEPPPCRATTQNGSRPPGGGKAHGNGHLWAAIPVDGHVRARPRGEPGLPRLNKDGSITDKLLWFGRLSSRTRKRMLTITARRIDADAATIRKGPRRGGWNGRALYWPGYVTFPTAGCWKVAGTAGKGTRLAFVLSVEPPPE